MRLRGKAGHLPGLFEVPATGLHVCERVIVGTRQNFAINRRSSRGDEDACSYGHRHQIRDGPDINRPGRAEGQVPIAIEGSGRIRNAVTEMKIGDDIRSGKDTGRRIFAVEENMGGVQAQAQVVKEPGHSADSSDRLLQEPEGTFLVCPHIERLDEHLDPGRPGRLLTNGPERFFKLPETDLTLLLVGRRRTGDKEELLRPLLARIVKPAPGPVHRLLSPGLIQIREAQPLLGQKPGQTIRKLNVRSRAGGSYIPALTGSRNVNRMHSPEKVQAKHVLDRPQRLPLATPRSRPYLREYQAGSGNLSQFHNLLSIPVPPSRWNGRRPSATRSSTKSFNQRPNNTSRNQTSQLIFQ